MSFEAASPSPISIPIPGLAGRRRSIVFSTDNMKVHDRHDDVEMSELSTCGIEEEKWRIREAVMSRRCDGEMKDAM